MSPTRLLRNARMAAHLSQAEVAEALGVSLKTVQRYEAGFPASRRNAEAVARFVERVEIQVSGRPLAVPASLRDEARLVHDEVLALAQKMIRSGERLPSGWRWNIYALVSFLRRSSVERDLVFAEEADTLVNEQLLLAEWRKTVLGADEYAEFRWRVIRVLRAIRQAGWWHGADAGAARAAPDVSQTG